MKVIDEFLICIYMQIFVIKTYLAELCGKLGHHIFNTKNYFEGNH